MILPSELRRATAKSEENDPFWKGYKFTFTFDSETDSDNSDNDSCASSNVIISWNLNNK